MHYMYKALIKRNKQLNKQTVHNIVIPNKNIPCFHRHQIRSLASTKATYYNYTPTQVATAYGLNLITTPNGTLRGTGITVAVIIAYHYPSLQEDLNIYCAQYGLPTTSLNIINLAGNSQDSSWALECCLDVQMIHSIAPGATIMVVEAASSLSTDLNTAINYAATHGAKVISMSWGSYEYFTQLRADNIFSNKNICYVCSSGDDNVVLYPSSSTNVLSVGGTSLYLNPNNTRSYETTWTSSGAGPSSYVAKPSYQSNIIGTKRSTPDVALIANPNTGFIVYCSVQGGYFVLGGTSASAPCMSGILAVANQLRVAANLPTLTTVSTATSGLIQKFFYQNIYKNNNPSYSTNFYDVKSGRNGKYTAITGYDYATGLGSVNANILCNSLLNI